MTWSTALRQFGRAIARTIRFQLGLVLVAWAIFVAGRVAATGSGLLGILFTVVAIGTVAFVGAFSGDGTHIVQRLRWIAPGRFRMGSPEGLDPTFVS